MDSGLLYHHETPTKEMLKASEWISQNSKVLELGCHTGTLSNELFNKGCAVTGIEINLQALERAKPKLFRNYCLDLNDPSIWGALNSEKFNTITWIHVLEHLIDPVNALNKSLELLEPNGTMIIGLPNISNARERFDMLWGKFEYDDIGVLDRTHLRFFNYITAQRFIHDAGLEIVDYYSAWRTNPTRQLLRHLPVLHHLNKWMNEDNPPGFPKYSRNLTDVTMLFKCVLKK